MTEVQAHEGTFYPKMLRVVQLTSEQLQFLKESSGLLPFLRPYGKPGNMSMAIMKTRTTVYS